MSTEPPISKSKTRAPSIRRGTCIILVAGMLLLLFLAYRMLAPRNLLAMAHPAFVVPEWRNQFLVGEYHWWLSQDEALVAIPDKQDGLANLVRYRRVGDSWQRFPVPLHDVPVSIFDDNMVGPSPDGKWFAWTVGDTLTVAALDGVRQMDSPSTFDTSFCAPIWSADSRRLTTYPAKLPGTALIFSLDNPTKSEQVSISLPKDRGWKMASVLNVTLDGRIIAQNDGEENAKRCECVEVGVGSHSPPPRYYSFPVPDLKDRTPSNRRSFNPSSWVPDPFFSPHGDSICWAMIRDEVQPWRSWAHKIVPRIPEVSDLSEIGWICHPGDTSVREIGWYPLESVPKGQKPNEKLPWIIDPKWMPDGKHMSFVWRDAVYTLPVE